MKTKTALFLLVALLWIPGRAFAQDPNFCIFLCCCLSTMEGARRIGEQHKTVDERFQVLEAVEARNLQRTNGNWYAAVPPLCRARTGVCPADYFGRTMVANLPKNIRVGIVNVAVAGCKIELFDKDSYQCYLETAPSWMNNIVQEYDD